MHVNARWSRVVGGSLMIAALGSMLAITTPAIAQDDPESVQLEVEAVALYVSPINDSIPNTLTQQFPPQVICVLFPDFCTEDSEPIRDPLSGVVQEVDQLDVNSPIQPVPPDSLAVSYVSGATRYQSGIRFALPSIPEGEELDSLVIEMPQSNPTYSLSSPLFRAIILRVVTLAGSRDGAAFVTLLAEALADESPADAPNLGIEACPLLIPLEDAPPPQAAPASSLVAEGPNGPEVQTDCLYGANGVLEDGTWRFDVTFAAKAWIDGSIPNNGLLLRPTGVLNLAFGDPDTTTNSQTVLDAAGPITASMASSEPFVPAPFIPPPPAPEPPPPSSTVGSGNISAPVGGNVFSAPPVSSPPTTTPPSTPTVAPPVAPEPVAAEPIAVSVQSSPWLFGLIPLFLFGAFLTARSLTTELVVATTRSGALTRLTQN